MNFEAKFRALMGSESALVYLDPLKAAAALHGIDTEERVAHFLAQVAHESAGFTRITENLNYSAKGLAATWPRRFRGADGKPNALALQLHRKPQWIASHVYANRMGNDDVASGDGWKYRGRGLIQLTGKDNYKAASNALYCSDLLVTDPDKVLQPDIAAMTACWFWGANGLNELADLGDVSKVTKRINGGTIGLEHRAKLTELALIA
jgi:putative chitinase